MLNFFFVNVRSVIFRRALSAGLAVSLAVFATHYLSLTQDFLVTMTAMLIVQSPLGSFVSHSVKRFLIIILSVTVGSLLILTIHQQLIIDLLMILVISMGCYIYYLQKNNGGRLTTTFVAVLMLFITMLVPYDPQQLAYVRAYDVIIGALIGISVGLIILPKRIDEEYRNRVTSILTAYEAYFSAIMSFLFRENNSKKLLQEKKLLVEDTLQTLPDWVYEAGFSPALRQGYRHFLVRTEQLGQILFSMHYVARHAFDSALLLELREPLLRSAEQIKKLLQALIIVLNLKTLTEGVDDFAEDMAALDKAFDAAFPEPTALTSMSTDYLYCAELICDLKDFRKMLLRLAQALR